MTKRQRVNIGHLPAAEKLIGLRYTAKEHRLMIGEVNEQLAAYEKLRAISVDNGVPPALAFDPRLPGMSFETTQRQIRYAKAGRPHLPEDIADIAFWPVAQLAALIRSKQISSVELTKLYLERLHRYDPILSCVVTFADDLALKQARRADREIARGEYRGLLHGIPYGAKDLLATRGIRPTCGAEPYRDQVPSVNAAVIERLEQAGAVLIAKLSVGALAWGDDVARRRDDEESVESGRRLLGIVSRIGSGNRRRSVSALRSARRRWAQSCRHPIAAASPDCVPHSGA